MAHKITFKITVLPTEYYDHWKVGKATMETYEVANYLEKLGVSREEARKKLK